jgi:hypothetical protein
MRSPRMRTNKLGQADVGSIPINLRITADDRQLSRESIYVWNTDGSLGAFVDVFPV